MNAFPLLDLPSQALAVERMLAGRSSDEKLAWLSAHGRLELVRADDPPARPVYLFESNLGLRCLFFMAGDKLVFFGDHTTYTIEP